MRRLLAYSAYASPLILSALAFAADETHGAGDAAGGHAPTTGGFPAGPLEGIMPLLATWIVFGAVSAVLIFKVWPRILGGLTEREEKIKNEIRSAEQARQQANDALEQYQKNLAEARAEAAQMIERTKQEQRRLAEELRAKSEREVTDLKQRAMQDIEGAKRAALAEIYGQMAGLATQVAGKILEREINPDDHRALVDDAVGKLGDLN
jgi:F-type H+-transporting ATPase subunit b